MDFRRVADWYNLCPDWHPVRAPARPPQILASRRMGCERSRLCRSHFLRALAPPESTTLSRSPRRISNSIRSIRAGGRRKYPFTHTRLSRPAQGFVASRTRPLAGHNGPPRISHCLDPKRGPRPHAPLKPSLTLHPCL